MIRPQKESILRSKGFVRLVARQLPLAGYLEPVAMEPAAAVLIVVVAPIVEFGIVFVVRFVVAFAAVEAVVFDYWVTAAGRTVVAYNLAESVDYVVLIGC